MMEFLTLGAVLGLSAGLSPGPLLALVISETLRHGVKSGIRVALSPAFTDLPIILLTLFVLAQISGYERVLGAVSLLGGVFILFMGAGSLFPRPVRADLPATAPKSLRKGILVNFLSPHPYLFWMSVGGAMMHRAQSHGTGTLVGFLAAFYVALIGAKITLALVVGRSRAFLSGPVYRNVMRLLGLVLCVLALFLFRDGLRLLGWLS